MNDSDLPAALGAIERSISGRLPEGERATFAHALEQLARGKDLSRAHWAFLADTLRHLPDTEARDVVAPVIAGMDLLASGQEWPGAAAAEAVRAAAGAWLDDEAESWAAWAAEAAADAAQAAWDQAPQSWAETEAVAWAVGSAAWAAENAAVETARQRDALLRLIAEAPFKNIDA